ncbi:MAG: helix-hairpin-helix domain-containing protein [Nitrospinae bacterium]|nr:helix-hairpin-helix domain-containing protein [Nitrospinota bacterium]
MGIDNKKTYMKGGDFMKKVLAFVFLVLFSFSVYASAADKININTATEVELTHIKGVGEKIAKNIIQFREEHGDFKTVEELANVKGVGEKVVENNKESLTVK